MPRCRATFSIALLHAGIQTPSRAFQLARILHMNTTMPLASALRTLLIWRTIRLESKSSRFIRTVRPFLFRLAMRKLEFTLRPLVLMANTPAVATVVAPVLNKFVHVDIGQLPPLTEDVILADLGARRSSLHSFDNC